MWAAFLIGFLGSLHCAGMCGPLAIVIHQRSLQTGRSGWQGLLLYHVGRVTTYAVLGVLVGLLSTALWGRLQTGLSVFAGVVLLLSAFSLLPWERQIWSLPGFRTLGEWIPRTYGRLMGWNSPLAPWLGGMVNGLLPCGLVYLGLSTALATGDPLLSAQMMLLFGLGTVPALVVTQLVGLKVRNRLGAVRKVVLPAFLLLTGTFLLLRAFSVPVPSDLRLLLEMTHIPMCH